jgi:hypothetical protein
MRTPGRRALLQRPVRPMQVAVTRALAQDQPQVLFARDQHPVQAFAAGAGDRVNGSDMTGVPVTGTHRLRVTLTLLDRGLLSVQPQPGGYAGPRLS